MTKLSFLASQLRKKLWLRPTLLSLGACTWVSLAYGLQYVLSGDNWPVDIERATLNNLFAILASSMLTVATFAVSALVATFATVSSTSTPRARELVMADTTAQTALASFIGAFIYAVVALVALSALTYGPLGRFGLFAGFVIAVGFVLMSFLRWVALVSNLGGLDDTIDRAEAAALGVFSSVSAVGGLGGREYGPADAPPAGHVITSPEIGYVCHVDMAALGEVCKRLDADIWLRVRPGCLADGVSPLAVLTGDRQLRDEDRAAIRRAFTIAHSRDLSVDPRFALIVLSEISDRALSPAVNDPGTAVRVLGVQLRLLTRWTRTRPEADAREPEFPRVRVPALSVDDLLDDAFMATARSGAAMLEVAMRLQKTLRALAALDRDDLRDAARLRARIALELAVEKVPGEHYREQLRICARSIATD
ncbi:MAG: DUF2254 domain-containing protein [Verrucomicrobiota bacterium]